MLGVQPGGQSDAFVTDDSYAKVLNAEAGFQSLTFFDFRFATNQREFKALHKKHAAFDNILVYAQTNDTPYEYYVLLDPKKPFPLQDFIVKDTIIGNKRLVLAVSKNAPPSDIDFIMGNLTKLE